MRSGLVREVQVSHDAGFRRRNRDVSKAHTQRGHRDHASKVFEDRMRDQQEARERLAAVEPETLKSNEAAEDGAAAV